MGGEPSGRDPDRAVASSGSVSVGLNQAAVLRVWMVEARRIPAAGAASPTSGASAGGATLGQTRWMWVTAPTGQSAIERRGTPATCS